VFVIGIDPHKGSHGAVVLDQDEQLVGELRVRAGRRQREELVVFASRFEPRCWAIEGATGTGGPLGATARRGR
jgi:transposase